ncbi:MAG: hypothetical protein QNK23_07290 [Crocinitomicaceae bacterium]|nr:hypothetical protein [Crocinitomicaceae bacterium]
MRLLIIILFTIKAIFMNAQPIEQTRSFDSLEVANEVDSLRSNFGGGLIVPSRYELSALKAISYYPELANHSIEFREARIKTTLNARPTVWSLLFRRKEKRRYIVRINTRKKDSLVLLTDVPFNAQVGVLGHEFGHFSDYSKRNFFGVLKRLFAYGSRKKKEAFEKEIDALTIERGLGWQLLDWSQYVLSESEASEKYKDFKRLIYLEPEEIEHLINKNN